MFLCSDHQHFHFLNSVSQRLRVQASSAMGPMKLAILFLAIAAFYVQAIDITQLRLQAAKNNLTCVLVFGDSSVDPGNNNHLDTTNKGNFPPYGKDFINGRPSGRFSNGRLATDFIGKFTILYSGIMQWNLRRSVTPVLLAEFCILYLYLVISDLRSLNYISYPLMGNQLNCYSTKQLL